MSDTACAQGNKPVSVPEASAQQEGDRHGGTMGGRREMRAGAQGVLR